MFVGMAKAVENRATVSGSVFLGLRRWFDEQYGREVFESLLDELPADARDLALSRALVNTSRIPAAIWSEIGRQAIARYGLNGDKGFYAAAMSIAMDDLSGYMKVLMKIGTPSFVLSRFPRVWRHYFSEGELEIVKRDAHSGTVVVRGAAAYGSAAQEGAVGWMRAAISYAGGRDVKVIRSQISEDESHYRIRWS